MKRSSLVVPAMICGFLLFTGLYGCGGDGGNSGNSVQNQEQARSDTIAVVRKVLSILVGSNPGGTQRQPQGTDRAQGEGITREQANVTVECNTGRVSFAGDATGTLLAFTLNGTLHHRTLFFC